MSSAAQTLTNQTNAQASTGPRTEAGKAVTRLNALRHGATAKAVVLPGEDPETYTRFQNALLTDLRPSSEAETDQAERVVALSWRLTRMYDLERSVMAQCMDYLDADSPDGLATLFTDPEQHNRIRLFHRYLTSAERAYNKALADYRMLQKENRVQERQNNSLQNSWLDQQEDAEETPDQPAHPVGKPVAVPPAQSVSFPQANTGFVSQNTKTGRKEAA